MPRIEVEDAGTFDVEEGKRLVSSPKWRTGGWISCTTSVRNHKKASEFRFRAVITEEGSQLLSLDH